jgi:hypothetical protein
MNRSLACTLLLSAALVFPSTAWAQRTNAQESNLPAAAQDVEGAVERAVERFRIGVIGGVAIDPEMIVFGAHGAFGPIFTPSVQFRPGLEFGVGELTTMLAVNLDVLYTLPGATPQTRWLPYIGAGPTFGFSHVSFGTDDVDSVDAGGTTTRNRFDFSDTSVDGGVNFIAGARTQGRTFFELRATAGGVSSLRLLAGFNF